jgi:hypothetical protein
MIRYRLANSRPGRNRPSLKYAAELEGRDEEEEEGRGGRGEVAVAKSSVAKSSVLPEGAPQAEQKRPAAVMSVPQEEQEGIFISFLSFSVPVVSRLSLTLGK